MMNDSAASNAPTLGRSVSGKQLCDILLASLTALAAVGEVEQACRLAGQACVALRHTDPKAARRFDVLLHRLTPALRW
jgi:hypothetical protein